MGNHRPPSFYFDLGSPYSYLAAERIDRILPLRPVWKPILLGAVFKATGRSSWAQGDSRQREIAEIERRASERGLMPLRWPDPFPTDTLMVMRAATYAAALGRTRAFALAAFRQAFAAGRNLADPDTVFIAAAACEISAKAVEKAVQSQTVKDALRATTTEAIAAGVVGVPSVVVDASFGQQIFWGDDQVEDAARALNAGDEMGMADRDRSSTVNR